MMWYRIDRENGLVELACRHGCGHPSKALTPPARYYGVHGCCGCCSMYSASFALVEMAFAGTDFTSCADNGELT